jgi:riboflavin synthase
MFTGIIQDVGELRSLEPVGGDLRLTVAVRRLSLQHCALGDSIAVSGVCLTVTAFGADWFAADVSRETLSLTTLGGLKTGSRVNLEPALRAGDALGGHLVSGHVDGIGTVESLQPDARSLRVRFHVPGDLARYLARKGSVAVDGVSLTVNDVSGSSFGVNLVPHTQTVTTFDALAPGLAVNIEVDQVARYVERLLAAGPANDQGN